jgi:hypothetical protein
VNDVVRVSFCCNDERGNQSGRARAVHVEDDGETIELESPWISETEDFRGYPLFDWSTDTATGISIVRVGHLRVQALGLQVWFGNVFWNAVRIGRTDAKRLVNYLVETRNWQILAGPDVSDLLPAGWADR